MWPYVPEICFGMFRERLTIILGYPTILAMALWALPAQAMTAEELETACREVDIITAAEAEARLSPLVFMKSYANAQRCLGFVDGFISGVAVAQVIDPEAVSFCQPKKGLSIDQARRIFLKYIAAHPEDLHWTAQTILTVALTEVFPCKRP